MACWVLQVILPTGTVMTVTEGWDGKHLGASLVLSSADIGKTEGKWKLILEGPNEVSRKSRTVVSG